MWRKNKIQIQTNEKSERILSIYRNFGQEDYPLEVENVNLLLNIEDIPCFLEENNYNIVLKQYGTGRFFQFLRPADTSPLLQLSLPEGKYSIENITSDNEFICDFVFPRHINVVNKKINFYSIRSKNIHTQILTKYIIFLCCLLYFSILIYFS